MMERLDYLYGKDNDVPNKFDIHLPTITVVTARVTTGVMSDQLTRRQTR